LLVGVGDRHGEDGGPIRRRVAALVAVNHGPARQTVGQLVDRRQVAQSAGCQVAAQRDARRRAEQVQPPAGEPLLRRRLRDTRRTAPPRGNFTPISNIL
jgi:hypothetical protein